MTSNHGHGRSPQSRAGDIWQIVRACLVVGCVIIAAIALSAMVVRAILPPEAMRPQGLGKPAATATWTSLIAFQALATALIILFVALREKGKIVFTFALGPPRAGSGEIVKLFALVVVVQGAFSLISYNFFREDMMRDLNLFREMIAGAPIWLAFTALVIGAPVAEEVLFRGYLMNQLSQTRIGFGGAAIASTFGWTLLHFGYSTIGLIEVFLAGLLFSWVLWRTGSLWVPMAFHALYNATVLMIILSMSNQAAT